MDFDSDVFSISANGFAGKDAGADGGLGDCTTDKRKSEKVNGRTVSNGDNVYSWQRGQEVR